MLAFQAWICPKIETRFKDKIDQSTDIIIEAMETIYKSKLNTEKAKREILDKLKKVMLDC